jgi:hypothetical protein
VLLLNVLFTQSGNFWIQPRMIPPSTGLIHVRHIYRSRDSSDSVVTSLRDRRSGLDSRQEQGFFLFPTASRLEKSGRNVRLATYLHLVPTLRKRVAIPPLPHTSSWLGEYLIRGTNLLLTLILKSFTSKLDTRNRIGVSGKAL